MPFPVQSYAIDGKGVRAVAASLVCAGHPFELRVVPRRHRVLPDGDCRGALEHVHTTGKGIHADFKPLNAVAVDSKFQLIDFDVFCKLGEPFGRKVPSSGYCPPEMARVLLEATDEKGKLLKATDEAGKLDGVKQLQKYKASVAYDLWSFGVVLYHLCFGRSLWNTDTNDNVERADLRVLASKPDGEALRVKLRKQGKIELQGVYSQDEGERTAAASVAGVITAMDGLPPKSVPNRFQLCFLIDIVNSILRVVPK